MPNLSFISPKAIVKESPIHGKGLFAVESIAQGEIVCIKGGSIIDRKTLESMPGWFRAAEIQIADDFFISPVKEEERRLLLLVPDRQEDESTLIASCAILPPLLSNNSLDARHDSSSLK